MTPLMQNLLTASFHGSVVICAVLLLRLILNKAPKRVICALWMLAFIRLLMPFQLESSLSLQPEAIPLEETSFYETMIENTSADDVTTTNPQLSDDNAVTEPNISEGFHGMITVDDSIDQSEPEPQQSPAPKHWSSILPYLWLVGTITTLLYAVVSYLQLKRTVREAVRIIGCWECDRIETAFILGYIRPRIYVPMGLSRRTRKHILSHEWAHLQTGDHWFKLLAYLTCCLHWFNPLVWVAYRMMCKDMEHACDERVVRYMDLEARKQYSHALLTCSTNHSHYTPCPVAFGEVSVKSRILSVLNYRKPSFWITLIAVIAVVCVGVFLMTSPEKNNSEQDELRQQIAALEEHIRNDPFYQGVELENLKAFLNVQPSVRPNVPTVSKTVTVSDVDQLLAAIAPDTHIILESGTYNLWEAADYGQSGNTYYEWGNDHQLQLFDLENLIISGSGMGETVILAQPSQADVLYMTNCHNIFLEGFTLGHLERPYPYTCTGYALTLDKSTNILMDSMGLYGCGVIGLNTQLCSNLLIRNSDIYDCSFYGICFTDTYYSTIENCRFYDIGIPQSVAGSVLCLNATNGIAITDCEITNNYVRNLMNCRTAYDVELSKNSFSKNTVSDAAFDLTSAQPVAANNRFEHNELTQWYNGTNKLHDALGAEITAEALDSIHATTPKSVGSQTEVHVSTVDEFLAAIAPNTDIVLDAASYDLSKATGYGKTNGEYYYWQQAYDGYELVIYKANNMTIRSSDDNLKKHTITAVPRYANVLHFNLCSNIALSGFTAGHTDGGGCGGGVIRLTSSKDILVDNCGLFGCGTIGVDIDSSESVTITDCDIYECSVGGVCVLESDTVTIQDTDFRDLGGYNSGYPGYVVAVLFSTNVTLDGEEVTDRINYSPENVNADEISFLVNGEPVDTVNVYDGTTVSVSADIGTFLKVEVDGIPEGTAVTWSYDDPNVISAVPQSDYCQVEIFGVGRTVLTALCGNVRKNILIIGTEPDDTEAVNTDLRITYAGQSLTECSAAVGDSIEFGTDILSSDNSYVINWSTDNPDVISVEYTSETTCTVHVIDTGEATLSAYEPRLIQDEDVKCATVKIYCRESW